MSEPTVNDVLLAEPRGFCAGVDRAVQTVERALDLHGAPVYVRKEIVHNKHVVSQLRERGAIFVDELDDSIPEGAIIVYADGACSGNPGPSGLGMVLIAALAPLAAAAQDLPIIGRPVDGAMGFQPSATELKHDIVWLDTMLLWIITAISVFVLFLLVYVCWKFNEKANPVPSKTSHNTAIEIAWTLIPVIALVMIAVPSIGLLQAQFKPAPSGAVTLKAIGNQWYWTYQYPDHGDFEIVSNMLPDAEAAKRGEPRLLAVDNRIVIPVGTEIKAILDA